MLEKDKHQMRHRNVQIEEIYNNDNTLHILDDIERINRNNDVEMMHLAQDM